MPSIRGDAVIANSHYTAHHVLAQHRIDKAKLHVIPRGIDVNAFTPENVASNRIDDIRKQWNLKSGKPVIIMPGRLTRLKGHLVFIEALAKLPSRDFEAVMIGDAQERDVYVDELRATIDRLNLTQTVRIAGHCSEKLAGLVISTRKSASRVGQRKCEISSTKAWLSVNG
jgi:glycosyltransferase involved in cell wall biosynthesis